MRLLLRFRALMFWYVLNLLLKWMFVNKWVVFRIA